MAPAKNRATTKKAPPKIQPKTASKGVAAKRTPSTPHPKKKERTVTDEYLDPPGLRDPVVKVCCAGEFCKHPIHPIDQKFVDYCEGCGGNYHVYCCGEDDPCPDDPEDIDVLCYLCFMERTKMMIEGKIKMYEANPWLLRTPVVKKSP
jgi:hypothetical protein